MSWFEQDNVYSIRGTAADRIQFNCDLAMFMEAEMINGGIESQADDDTGLQSTPIDCSNPRLPSNRVQLIKEIEDSLHVLTYSLGSARSLYDSIKANEMLAVDTSRARKDLNIVLMGKAGLRDGPVHLNALKRHLQNLKRSSGTTINKNVTSVIEGHFDYIFSAKQHEDYPALLAQYEEKNNSTSKVDATACIAMTTSENKNGF